MDVHSDNHEVNTPGSGRFWYANTAVSDNGNTTEVHLFANDIAQANAIGQGIAIAKSHHMNSGAKYVATRADYDECFGS